MRRRCCCGGKCPFCLAYTPETITVTMDTVGGYELPGGPFSQPTFVVTGKGPQATFSGPFGCSTSRLLRVGPITGDPRGFIDFAISATAIGQVPAPRIPGGFTGQTGISLCKLGVDGAVVLGYILGKFTGPPITDGDCKFSGKNVPYVSVTPNPLPGGAIDIATYLDLRLTVSSE